MIHTDENYNYVQWRIYKTKVTLVFSLESIPNEEEKENLMVKGIVYQIYSRNKRLYDYDTYFN